MAITAFRGMRPFYQLVFTLFVILVSFLVVSVVALLFAIPIFGVELLLGKLSLGDFNDPEVIGILKYMQTVQSIGIFIVPPIVLAYLFQGSVSGYLHMRGKFNYKFLLIAVLLIVIANPAINFLGGINESMQLPDFMAGIEARMKQMEENAAVLIERFMDVKTTGGLLFNLFMIAVLPGLGEEFLFRGVLQRIFSDMTRNYHLGIWISAFLFSAIHMQFYGFLPRLMLGAMFGYLFVWSGSLWVPICAHFVNNAAGVLGLYFIRRGQLDPSVEEIGSGQGQILLASLSIALTASLLWYAWLQYKKEEQTQIATVSEE